MPEAGGATDKGNLRASPRVRTKRGALGAAVRSWTVLLAVLPLAAGALLGSCRLTGGAAASAVRLGYLGTLTGSSAASGIQAQRGAALALEDWNATGQLPALEWQVADDQGIPSMAQARFEELWRDGTRLFIGPLLTSAATQLYYSTFRLHALVLGPVIAGANLSGRDDFLFKLFPSTVDFGRRLGLMASQRGLRKMVVVSSASNREYSLGIFDAFLQVWQADLPEARVLVDHWMYEGEGAAEISRKVGAWRRAGADGVLLILPVGDMGKLTTALTSGGGRRGAPLALLSSPWAIQDALLAQPGVEGLQFVIPLDYESPAPRFAEFRGRFRARFGEEPSYHAVFNYEAVRLLAGALQRVSARSGEFTPEEVKRELLATRRFEGLQEDFDLNRFGDGQRSLWLHEVRGGRFRRVREGEGGRP